MIKGSIKLISERHLGKGSYINLLKTSKGVEWIKTTKTKSTLKEIYVLRPSGGGTSDYTKSKVSAITLIVRPTGTRLEVALCDSTTPLTRDFGKNWSVGRIRNFKQSEYPRLDKDKRFINYHIVFDVHPKDSGRSLMFRTRNCPHSKIFEKSLSELHNSFQ